MQNGALIVYFFISSEETSVTIANYLITPKQTDRLSVNHRRPPTIKLSSFMGAGEEETVRMADFHESSWGVGCLSTLCECPPLNVTSRPINPVLLVTFCFQYGQLGAIAPLLKHGINDSGHWLLRNHLAIIYGAKINLIALESSFWHRKLLKGCRTEIYRKNKSRTLCVSFVSNVFQYKVFLS